MKRYIYSYETVVRFSEPIIHHALLLRPLPVLGSYMNVEEEHLVMPSNFHAQRSIDALGNRIVYGGELEAHASLAYVSTGIVGMESYLSPTDALPLMVYRQTTPLTFLSENQVETLDCPADALAICHKVNEWMNYSKHSTGMDTPASEVALTRKGVCQDYAHLMVALCRAKGMAARYVCGLMEGEGETHAWVEVNDGYGWRGYDPTNDLEISMGYIKLAHGRDASDCPVNRGTYRGKATQLTDVHVMVRQI